MADNETSIADVSMGEGDSLLVQSAAADVTPHPSSSFAQSNPTGPGAALPVPDQQQSIPSSESFQSNGAPPALASKSTPSRALNGTPEVSAPLPTKAASHGAPARRYLNEKVTGVLLEGMKRLAAEQPEDPLRVLGEFLIQKSRELEGTAQ